MTMPVTPTIARKIYAGDPDHRAEDLGLGMRVLPDRRVEHEQHGMRRRGIDLFEDAHDLLQFAHQIGLVVEAPGGVDQQQIGALFARPHQGVVGEPGGIRPGRAGQHRTLGALAPDLQLLDRGRPERVAGGEEHRFALIAVLFRQLADRRRLAAAVDPDDEDHEGPDRRVDAQRLHHRLDQPDDLHGERGAHLLGRDLLVEAGSPERGDHLAGDADPHIAGDQQIFQLAERIVVEPAAQEDRVDPLIEPRRATRQPAAQLPEPAARLRRLRLWLGAMSLWRRRDIRIRRGIIGDAAPPEPHGAGTPTRAGPRAATSRIWRTAPTGDVPSHSTAA